MTVRGTNAGAAQALGPSLVVSIEGAGLGLIISDGAAQIVWASRRASQLLGRPAESLLEIPLRTVLEQSFDARGADGAHWTPPHSVERVVSNGSAPRWLAFTTSTADGLEGVRYTTLVADRTVQRNGDLLREALLDLQTRFFTSEPGSDALTHACARGVDVFGVPLAWIGAKEPDGKIAVRASAGPARRFLERVALRWDDPGADPLGISLRDALPVTLDVLSHPTAWGAVAADHGLRHATSVPLTVEGQVLGCFVVHTPHREALKTRVEDITAFANHLSIFVLRTLFRNQSQLQNVALSTIGTSVYITDPQGLLVWTNPAFSTTTGYTAEEVLGKPFGIMKEGVEPDFRMRSLWDSVQTSGQWSGELCNRKADGSVFVSEEAFRAVYDTSGRLTHVVATQLDLSERKAHEESMRRLREYDALTHLPNRHALERRLRSAVASGAMSVGALIMLDIERFSLVNDAIGPVAGDGVLVRLSELIAGLLPDQHMLARWGGDEFAILMESCTVSEAEELAQLVQAAVAAYRVDLGGTALGLGATVGISAFRPGDDPVRVMAVADAALYAARDLGPGRRFVVVDPSEPREGQNDAGAWATRLRDALEVGGLILHFQPVVRLRDGAFEHHEVLLRMTGPDGNLIYPNEFIGAAERYGIMPHVDVWVLRECVGILWKRPDARLFVNLSGTALRDPVHLAEMEDILSRIPAIDGRLTFEITETAAVIDLAHARTWMTRLRGLGCRFALDDFGTGFSTFAYLADLPVDYVKIDGSFVTNIARDARCHALVKAISTVARTLGKEVIAEGVEASSAVGILQGLGIEFGQGYLWGAPHSALSTQ